MVIASFIISVTTFIIGALVLVKFDQKIKSQTIKLNEQQTKINDLQLVVLQHQVSAIKKGLSVEYKKEQNKLVVVNNGLEPVYNIRFIPLYLDLANNPYANDLDELPNKLEAKESFTLNFFPPMSGSGKYIVKLHWKYKQDIGKDEREVFSIDINS